MQRIDQAIYISLARFGATSLIALIVLASCTNSGQAPIDSVQSAQPSVVRITTDAAEGSGVIVETDGANGRALVLTNQHVIAGSRFIEVTVQDAQVYEAEVVGSNDDMDLALLSICCGEFKALPFASADDIRTGASVVSLGYAFGLEGSPSATSGIVSAVRFIPELNLWVVQTDAQINPGSSGGPLINDSGHMIGVNLGKVGGLDVEGVGMAISIQTVRYVLPDLKRAKPGSVLVATPTPALTYTPPAAFAPTPTPPPTPTFRPRPTATPRTPEASRSLLVTLYPTKGPVGSTIIVSVSGFTPLQAVIVRISGIHVTGGIVGRSGTLSTYFVVPENLAPGARSVTVHDARSGTFLTGGEFTVTAKQFFATFETSKGKIKFELLAAEAPVTVNNFLALARDGYYDGVTFHRVLAGFMAQGGDPTGTGSGGPGYTIVDEFYCTNGATTNAHPADCELATTFDAPGILAMANTGRPGTGGSQFFITFVPTPHLNGLHTIFGRVVEGMDVVNSLQLRDPWAGGPSDQIDRIVIEES